METRIEMPVREMFLVFVCEGALGSVPVLLSFICITDKNAVHEIRGVCLASWYLGYCMSLAVACLARQASWICSN